MVCGTGSDVGKTTVVAGLCRLLARRGVRVAPFKAQNMALNSVVTDGGHEIGRAQALQAAAARVPAEVEMNPVLLKPTSERTAQVVVRGHAVGVMGAVEYHNFKPRLFEVVLDALADLRARYDVVLLEGAGSPAEINLLEHDIANLRVASAAGIDAVLVGDIDRGGVFASLYGTVALLPEPQRARVRGFVINKLRGDPALLGDGSAQLEARCGIPTVGVLPWVEGPGLDAEDSLALRAPASDVSVPLAEVLDVAVVTLPRIANFTDVDPLVVEPGVRVRFVHDPAGSETLTWCRAGQQGHRRRPGLAASARPGRRAGPHLGRRARHLRRLPDVGTGARRPDRVGRRLRRRARPAAGLDPIRSREGAATVSGNRVGCPIDGYQIHHGRVHAEGGEPFVALDRSGGEPVLDGVQSGRWYGTTVHGLFEADRFRGAFLARVAAQAGKRFVASGVSYETHRQARIDHLADVLDAHLDVSALDAFIAGARPPR